MMLVMMLVTGGTRLPNKVRGVLSSYKGQKGQVKN
jgi:hypothetical protein